MDISNILPSKHTGFLIATVPALSAAIVWGGRSIVQLDPVHGALSAGIFVTSFKTILFALHKFVDPKFSKKHPVTTGFSLVVIPSVICYATFQKIKPLTRFEFAYLLAIYLLAETTSFYVYDKFFHTK